MGVERTDYIIFGWKLSDDCRKKINNLNQNNEDLILPYIEGWADCKYRIIEDGMSDEYSVFGIELESADQYNGWDFFEIEIDKIKQNDILKLKEEYNKLFGIILDEPKLFIFSHYW